MFLYVLVFNEVEDYRKVLLYYFSFRWSLFVINFVVFLHCLVCHSY